MTKEQENKLLEMIPKLPLIHDEIGGGYYLYKGTEKELYKAICELKDLLWQIKMEDKK